MQNRSTAIPQIAHPEWCAGGWCEVHPRVTDHGTFADGLHFSGALPVRGSHGWELVAELYSETRSDGRFSEGDDGTGVALRIAANTDMQGVNRGNKWTKGETIMLEPEEAELLGRRLLEVAAEARTKLKLLMV